MSRRKQADAGERARSDAMDEALAMLRGYAPSFRGGLSNHGPMAAEALVSLGHDDAVIPWVESYRKQLEPRSAPRQRITDRSWQAALGDRSRVRDWDDWFVEQMEEHSWQDVLARWVPRLAPGMAAAGLHGVIRVGHAVCSLVDRETSLRREELARALAYWAAEFLQLPGHLTTSGALSPSRALLEVRPLPAERRRSRGLISTQLRELEGFEPFLRVIDLVDTEIGSPDFLAEMVSTFAGTFTNTTSNSFDFLHAVTGSAAVTELLPFVMERERSQVCAYAWQATAAIFARYSGPGLSAAVDSGARSTSDFSELVELAVDSRDAHTIKLAAACRREWQRNPDPRLLTATAKRVRAR